MNSESASLPNITLGWELEAIGRARKSLQGIEVAHDGSVNGESLEYRVRRELVFTPEKSLAALRNLATDTALRVDSSCGFHVHLGLARRSRKIHAWAGWFVQLARDLEDEAFMAVPESRRQNSYCRSWRSSTGSVIAQQYSPSKGANRDRYNWVNPVEIFRPGGIRTIEVRLMGNTKRYTYLLAWISVCRLMAMSSWALVFDPSRLEYERQELKKAFKLVKENFLRPDVPTHTVAKTALYLSQKAGFNAPFGKPLANLTRTEQDLAYRLHMDEVERKEYEQVMKAMRQSVEEYRDRVRENHLSPVGALIPGDTVQCVQRDPDEGITVGHFYRVIHAEHHQCTILNDAGREWHIPVNCVRLAERIGQETCAV